MDTGSNFNLSGSRSDFQQIQQAATVRITGIDGDVNGGRPAGFVGKLKPNNLGLRYGVWYPPLGVGQPLCLDTRAIHPRIQTQKPIFLAPGPI
jgi:hypothetical protein